MGRRFDFHPERPVKASDGFVYAWPAAPARTEAVTEAGDVARPTRARGCWGIVRTTGHGKALETARRCQCRARGGRLTCVAHRRLEGAARELESRSER